MLDRVVGMAVLADLWISFGTLQAKDQIALESRSARAIPHSAVTAHNNAGQKRQSFGWNCM